MANWTPIEFEVSGDLTLEQVHELATILAEDTGLPPVGCLDVSDIEVELKAGRALVWENADVAAFPPRAETYLRSAGLSYEFTVTDGIGGVGETVAFDAVTGARATEDVAGEDWGEEMTP